MKLKKGELNDQLMATAAHRYCLGRASYIVPTCLEWIDDTWDQFDRNTQRVMVRDTIEFLMQYKARNDYEEHGWKAFAERGFNSLPEEDQEWVRRNVAWRSEPWPLSVL